MSEVHENGKEPLSLSALGRIDDVCDRFEEAWRAGRQPAVEEFVQSVQEPERAALRRELLRVQGHYLDREPRPPASRSTATQGGKATATGQPDPGAELLLEGTPAQLGRYQLGERIGRGGVGEVFRVHDSHMGRDLAVKVLREEHRKQLHLVHRFLEEARIAGRLQHPGVAPVYDRGEAPDGRPYFAMKLVEGQDLAALLAGRTDAARDLPRFLAVFTQVCQTMAYAHGQGVIHRDLKPANVMVGAFGEVQVMDWGLAKVLSSPAAADPGDGKPEAAVAIGCVETVSAGWITRPGQVMGTLAYIAPEQARGEVDRVDERADVFGLGAILCEILTGETPFTGESVNEVWAKARGCDHAEALARLEACGADRELLQLVRACLAAEPCERPRDAGVVAEQMTAYLAGVQERLRAAELERAAAQARAEEARATAAAERKARRRAVGLAAAVVGLLGLGLGGGLWLQGVAAERRAEQVRQDEAHRRGAEEALVAARPLQEQARWPQARAVLKQALEQLGAEAPAEPRQWLEQALRDLDLVARLDTIRLNTAVWAGRTFDYAGADRDYADAFRKAELGEESEDAGVVAERVRASAVRTALVAALDHWAYSAQEPKRRVWLCEVARLADPDPWRNRLRDPAVWRNREGLAELAVETLGNLKTGASANSLSPQLLASLGVRLRLMGRDAIPLLTAGQARHPDDFWLNYSLAVALSHAHHEEGAVGYLRAALAARPETAAVYNNLGLALKDKGQLDEAIAAYRKAIALDPTLARAHNNLGNALHDKGRLDEAIDHYHQAIQLDPKDAKAHNDLGTALADKGRLDQAIDHYHQALQIDPKDAKAHYNLGLALYNKGRLNEAIGHYEQALQIDPKLANAHNGLGAALKDKCRLDEAIAHYQQAIRIDPKLAQAHYNLGNALQRKGQLEEAIEHYQQALHLHHKSAQTHYSLGTALHDKGGLVEAIAEYRMALEIDPKLAQAHYNLGRALGAQWRLEDAIVEYKRAIECQPNFAEAHCNLGIALRNQGRFADALVALQRGDELGRKWSSWRQPSAQWVRETERMAELDLLLPRILRGEAPPAESGDRLLLADMCRMHKQLYRGAARFYADAFAARPALAENLRTSHRYNAACAAALAAAGQGNDAKQLDDKERARLRQQALAWLRADLAARTKALESAKPEERTRLLQQLQSWQRNPNLIGLRDADAVAKLPAGEQASCKQLWAEVDALLKRARDK